MSTLDQSVSRLALAAGYTPEEIQAGLEFAARKARRSDPPGKFDKAGRFYADERTQPVLSCRNPTRAHPYPEMHAARTAAHCAEVYGAEEILAVKRVAKLRDELDAEQDTSTAHAQIAARRFVEDAAKRILKPVKRAVATMALDVAA